MMTAALTPTVLGVSNLFSSSSSSVPGAVAVLTHILQLRVQSHITILAKLYGIHTKHRCHEGEGQLGIMLAKTCFAGHLGITYEEDSHDSENDDRPALKHRLIGSSNGGLRFNNVGLLLLHVEKFA
jgi:hypothetical protein